MWTSFYSSPPPTLNPLLVRDGEKSFEFNLRQGEGGEEDGDRYNKLDDNVDDGGCLTSAPVLIPEESETESTDHCTVLGKNHVSSCKNFPSRERYKTTHSGNSVSFIIQRQRSLVHLLPSFSTADFAAAIAAKA